MTARHDKSPLIGVSDLGPSKLLRRRESKPIHHKWHHRRHRMRYVKWQMLIAVLMVGLVGLGMFELEKHEFQPILHRRRLSTNTTCEVTEKVDDSESKAIGEFPKDFFTNRQRRNGAILAHVLIMVYMFSALAFVCDSFFESSLERIVEEFQITDDVAGATWMAAGGSAPELATSMIGALITKSDIGFGTIVGSAVFNVLFVIGACAFVVGNGLKLTAYPLARDSTWYTVCLIFIVLAVYDQKVHVWESAILFGLYCIYILIMKFNTKLSAWFAKHKSKYEIKPAGETGDEHEKEAEEEEEDDDEDFMAFPDGLVDRIIYVIVLPLKAFMVATIPDCNKKPKLYLVTFSMCVVHIALYSYVMVWMANAIGITLRIPDEVMGVTILAMGTSIPDALSSIAVARRGHGDMAVSSSIGSNIFDITVGLPIPWMLYSLKTSVTDSTDPPYVTIQSNTIGISVGTLLLMLLSTIGSIHWNKWKLDTRLGYMLLGLYLIFFIETLVLFFVKDPECQ